MTRRTMTGVCILLGSNPYFMGSEEANYWGEYRAMPMATLTSELRWLTDIPFE